MITIKQKQRDNEYEADYQSKCPYSADQWKNMASSGQISDEEMALLKDIYSSFNHVANLLQLSFQLDRKEEDLLEDMNRLGQKLAQVNGLQAEVDFSGQEYWWYLLFWGKHTEDNVLEWKMQPELAEAIGGLFPELEESYYAAAGEIERSLQIRYQPEEAVWVGAAVLLYEKYYRYPGISADDILLMQYELQTRSQKIYGQDIESNVIASICNADARGHRYNYLRDIYKYYRVSFPGEFEEDRERPDPEDMDYSAYVYSIYGYMPISELVDFIDHEYARLVDSSYVELENASGFVRLSAFVSRQGGTVLPADEKSEKALTLQASGQEAAETFHQLADSLLAEYPNFSYAAKADWKNEEDNKVNRVLCDLVYIESYKDLLASVAFCTVTEGDQVNLEVSLNLPVILNSEIMEDIREKCSMLTLMTTAPFQVNQLSAQPWDLQASGEKIKVSVLYPYDQWKTMSEEDICGLVTTASQVLASNYTDICHNYYPRKEEPAEDPLAAALGSKLVYRPASEVPEPTVIYREGTVSASTEYITKSLQNYDFDAAGQTGSQEASREDNSQEEVSQEDNSRASGDRASQAANAAAANKIRGRIASQSSAPSVTIGGGSAEQREVAQAMRERKAAAGAEAAARQPGMANPDVSSGPGPQAAGPAQVSYQAAGLPGAYLGQALPGPSKPKSDHPDRKDQGFRLYPKNTLVRGPMKTGKYHEAIMTAVGIVEGKDRGTLSIEPVPDILDHYHSYVEDGRILQVSYPDLDGHGYDAFIERVSSGSVHEGLFKRFANSCADGRYVLMLEDVDLSWPHLFGETTVLLRENRREGASSETVVTLQYSQELFSLPTNLYIVATCDSHVSEDTVLGALNHDFFIKPVLPDSRILRTIRIEGISLERMMNALNQRISYFLGPDYQLGEGFFLASPDKDSFVSLARVFREQIIPLLEKWFDQDYERIRYVLGDNGKTRLENVFYRETVFRRDLFKGQLPDSFDRERRIYEINEDAFKNPRSYVGIYE